VADPVARANPTVRVDASQAGRTVLHDPRLARDRLQRSIGNRAVSRLLDPSTVLADPTELSPARTGEPGEDKRGAGPAAGPRWSSAVAKRPAASGAPVGEGTTGQRAADAGPRPSDITGLGPADSSPRATGTAGPGTEPGTESTSPRAAATAPNGARGYEPAALPRGAATSTVGTTGAAAGIEIPGGGVSTALAGEQERLAKLAPAEEALTGVARTTTDGVKGVADTRTRDGTTTSAEDTRAVGHRGASPGTSAQSLSMTGKTRLSLSFNPLIYRCFASVASRMAFLPTS
jgi:hypothetical protein